MGGIISRRIIVLCGCEFLSGSACGIENDYQQFQQLTQDPSSSASQASSSGSPASSSGSSEPAEAEAEDSDAAGTGPGGAQSTGGSTTALEAGSEGSSTSAGEPVPVCGDLVVEGDEECDDGDPACNGCIRDRLFFVTSESVSGSFLSEGGLLYHCNHYAGLAGLLIDGQPRFRPWLSDNSQSAAQRLHHSPGRYVLRNGEVLAESWEDLVDGELLRPPNIDEHGELREVDVWTGSLPDGSGAPGTTFCDDWKSDDIDTLGSWGYSGYKDARWSYWEEPGINPTTCSSWSSLYCVESL